MRVNRIQTWRILAMLAIIGGGALLSAQTDNDLPLSIQRIVLPPERAAKELEKVPRGGLLRLPLDEFEARLVRIRADQRGRDERPRLASAHYAGEIVERYLHGHAAEWSISHAGRMAGVLPIEPLNLALSRVRWKEGGDALLADLDGKSLGLLVEPGSAQKCLFAWSARGTPTAGGVTFSLSTPTCPISTFELTLPADHWLSASKTASVSGPHPATTPDKRLWNLQVTGSKPLDITVRKIAQAKSPGMTLFSQVRAIEHLAPDRIEIEHEFEIDVLHGSVPELMLDGDGDLQPYDVTLKGGEIKSWEWSPNKKDIKGKQPGKNLDVLAVAFRQPVQGKLGLRVKSLAARPTLTAWTSPSLRVRGALTRGESLEVHLAPDMPTGPWDFGTFETTQLTTDPLGKQIIRLAQTAPDIASARRPSLHLPPKEMELRTSEQMEWHLGPRSAELKANLQYALARGNVFAIAVKLPGAGTGYAIESLELLPAESLRSWSLSGDTLIVELKQALTPGKKMNLKVHLRAPFRELLAGNRTHAYPDVVPLESTKRDGTARIFIDSRLHAQLLTSTVPLASDADEKGNRDGGADFRLDYRDQKLAATVRVTPLRAVLDWTGSHTVKLAEDRALLRFRWVADPIVGAPQSLDFRFAPNFPPGWTCRTDEGTTSVHHRERLYLQEALPHLLHLGSLHRGQSALLESLLPSGSLWRVHFSEPITKKTSLLFEAETSAGISPPQVNRFATWMARADAMAWIANAMAPEKALPVAGMRSWDLPLIAPSNASIAEQAIAVDSPQASIQKWSGEGFIDARKSAEQTPFRLQLRQETVSHRAIPLDFSVVTLPEKRAASLLERCEDARITTLVHKDGNTYHRIQFQLWHWRSAAFPLHLPHGTQVVGVKIHDRWLDRLEIAKEADAGVLTLPFDQNSSSVRYEIHLRSGGAPSWCTLGMNVAIPKVDWPVAPLEVRARLGLGAAWAPLVSNHLTPIGIPKAIAMRTPAVRQFRQAWNFGQAWWPFGEAGQLADKLAEQRQALLTAEAQMRGSGMAKPTKLAAVLERFATAHLKEGLPLIIDEPALRSLGLSGETMIQPFDLGPQAGRPFWEKLGLTCVPGTRAALLTSPRRLEQLGIDRPARVVDLDDTLDEAILHGRDASAGFYLIVAWLKIPTPEVADPQTGAPFPISEYSGDFQEMSEWEVTGPLSQGRTVLLVDPRMFRIAGWTIAFGLAFLLWVLHARASFFVSFRVQILILVATALAAIWLPGILGELAIPSLVAAAASLAVLAIRMVVSKASAMHGGESTLAKPATKVAALLFGVVGLAWTAPAQPVAERIHPVYILDGNPPTALVTPELIARLDQIEKRTPPASRDAILYRASYQGTVKDGWAHFDVDYDIHCFAEQARLLIPLQSVQLRGEAFLDGAPAFPTLAKVGYSVPVQGKGTHRLRLSFSARVNSASDHADLRFTIPRLAQSEMFLTWANPVHGFRGKNIWGSEEFVDDGSKALKSWRGQLGWETEVHIDWSNQAGSTTPKMIEIKEMHYWDLRLASPRLWTTLQYSVGTGTFGQCSVAIPEGFHVRGVDAATSALPPAAPAFNPLLVKQWQVIGKGGQRRILVDFTEPASGNFVLNLELVPQAMTQKKQLLLLPAAIQGKSVSGFVGYRVDGGDVRTAFQNLAAVERITPVEFEQLWKKQGGIGLETPSTHAYSFQRKSPQAGIELALTPGARQCQAQYLWHLDQTHADLVARFSLTSDTENLGFVEFTVDPKLTVSDVHGPDVYRWHLQGNVLQVWMRQARKQTTMEIAGWQNFSTKKGPAGKDLATFPNVVPTQIRVVEATLDLQVAPGLEVVPTKLNRVRANPAEPNRFAVDGFPCEADFVVRPDRAPPHAVALTSVQRTQAGIDVSHRIRLTTHRGRLPVLKIQVRDGVPDNFSLDAPGASVVLLRDKQLKPSGWLLNYPVGQQNVVDVTLRGRVSASDLSARPLSSVEVEGATLDGVYLAWKDVEMIAVEGEKKLASQKNTREKLAAFGVASLLGDDSAFHAAVRTGPVKVALPRTSADSQVRILASTQTARMAGDHWLHAATFWVVVQETTELHLHFPIAVAQVRANIDSATQVARQVSDREILIPVEASAAPRRLEIRWVCAERNESREMVSIGTIRVGVPAPSAHHNAVLIPPDLIAPARDLADRATLLARLLHDAQTQVLISAALAQEPTLPDDNAKAIAASQQQFHANLRQAEYALAALKLAAPTLETAPAAGRLLELKRINADNARQFRYEDQRKAAEKGKKLVLAGSPRMDGSFPGVSLLAPIGSAHLSCISVREQRSARHQAWSEFLILGAVFFLVLSFFRRGLWLVCWMLPELLAAACLIGMVLHGTSLLGLSIMAGMLATRVVGMAKFLRARIAASRIAIPAGSQTATQTFTQPPAA